MGYPQEKEGDPAIRACDSESMRSTEKITLPWQDLREWDGSVRKAFEQVCNQFASCEDVSAGSRFISVAAPDGGVEGYWI